MPSLRSKKTKSLKQGDLVSVTTPKSQTKIYGVITRCLDNYYGSANFVEVLVGSEMKICFSNRVEVVDIETSQKMQRFQINFKSVIESTDKDATMALEGDAIVIGASTAELQEELTAMLPEEFEGVPVIVVDMSGEDYES